jgi:hypothetical protein
MRRRRDFGRAVAALGGHGAVVPNNSVQEFDLHAPRGARPPLR